MSAMSYGTIDSVWGNSASDMPTGSFGYQLPTTQPAAAQPALQPALQPAAAQPPVQYQDPNNYEARFAAPRHARPMPLDDNGNSRPPMAAAAAHHGGREPTPAEQLQRALSYTMMQLNAQNQLLRAQQHECKTLKNSLVKSNDQLSYIMYALLAVCVIVALLLLFLVFKTNGIEVSMKASGIIPASPSTSSPVSRPAFVYM